MHLTVPVPYRRTLLLLPLVLVAALAFLRFGFPVFPVADASSGITYYVSPSGSDLNTGSETQPFKTIQKAADVVNPGDTVLVEDGVYQGNKPCAGTVAVVCLSRGGNSTAPVTFRSRNRHGAQIQGQVGLNNEGWYFLSGANYVTVDGFDIYGIAAITATGGASGFALYNGGSFSRLRHNKIHDIGKICTDTTKGQNGIFVQQPNVTIEGNQIYNIGRFQPGENDCAPSTANYQNHDHGIYIDGSVDGTTITGANGSLVKNNIFYKNQRGWSIQLYPGSLTDVLIANNTFAFPNPYRTGHLLVGANLTATQIVNNIFYEPNLAAVNFYSGTLSNVVIKNNITYGASITNTTPPNLTLGSNSNRDPLLTAPLLFDFHPQIASPVVDGGLVLATVSVDFDDNPRPRGNSHDVGAYEMAAETAPTPTPTPTATPTPTPTPLPSPTPTLNLPPAVVLGSPITGSSFLTRSIILIEAMASDVDGRVTKVEFYKNGVFIGADTSSPYTLSWSCVSSGSYSLTAKATDDLGATTTSPGIWVNINTSPKPRKK